MAKLRFQFDEHMANSVARALRRHHIDAVTTAEADLLGATDADQLAHARGEGRVMVTKDDDFLRLDSQGQPHAGIAYFSQARSIGVIVAMLLLMHDVYDSADMAGRVEYL